ncbi:hypothetical protein MMC07_007566 [Pseudocyphellaria aurata]|nr:hypothetical protein [Pseudocyphellaria aurata]
MPISPASNAQRQSAKDESCHFTLFIRLPFPRGDFVDPPAVSWDSEKDRELWDELSRASKSREVDWQALAEKFDVTLPFLLQQAAWLYEQQLSQVKAQLRKASRPVSSTGASPTPSSVSGSGIGGGHALTRGGSGGSRVPSALSNRPREPVSRDEGSTFELPGRVKAPQVSRNPSTNAALQMSNLAPSILQRPAAERQASLAHPVGNRDTSRRSIDTAVPYRLQPLERRGNLSEKANDSSSSSSDSETAAPLTRSRAYMPRSRGSTAKPPLGPLSDADEDQEDSAPFLPFSDAKAFTVTPPPDPSATLRIAPEKLTSRGTTPGSLSKLEATPSSQTAHSVSSSLQSQPQSLNIRPAQTPLSSLSPRQRQIAREGSEGTPSMGSSFSDLDDASVTQSALEEALANEMSHGVASRMSTISQALRSRYL